MTEAQYTKKFTKLIEADGGLLVVIAGGNVYQPSGLPDRFMVHPSWCGWIEFKTTKGRLSKIQRRVIDLWYRRGCGVVVAYCDDNGVVFDPPWSRFEVFCDWDAKDLINGLQKLGTQ